MRIILPKDVSDALDVCTPYLVHNRELKRNVLKEDTPQEIRELYKKTHERIQELLGVPTEESIIQEQALLERQKQK